MPFDPAIPRTNSPIASAELRDQLQGIQNNIDAVREHLNQVQPLGLTVSNPPTQAELQAIANRLEELLNNLITA